MENHHFLIGKSTISIAIFNMYVSLPEGTHQFLKILQFPNDPALQDYSPAMRPPREKGPAPLGRTQRVHRAKTHLISSGNL